VCHSADGFVTGIVGNYDLNVWTQADQDFKFQVSRHHYINLTIQLARKSPLYQMWLPLWVLPPCLEIVWDQMWCWLLYASRCCRGRRKKMWSSTHLDRGPMPLARRMSAPASARRPWAPPAEARPKLLFVFAAKLSSPWSPMTRPGHWSWCTGIVLYASATSLMEAWDPGGKW